MDGGWALVGMGSNLRAPPVQLRRASLALRRARGLRVLGASGVYATPSEPPGRPPYLNAVALVRTGLDPWRTLRLLRRLEAGQGRVRRRRHASRSLDLDLLCHGPARRCGRQLRLPHPGLGSRGFVLRPLADLAPRLAARLAARPELCRLAYPRRGPRLPVRPLGDTMKDRL